MGAGSRIIKQENMNYLRWHQCVHITLSRYRDTDNTFAF